MAQPDYRIFYGKYPDALTNELPNDQIMSVSGLQFRIEPGKPAEPKVGDCEFTLVNLDWQGTKRYDNAWFDNESRIEGAVIPQQLFFKIEITATGQHFLGVLDSKSYGKWRETVTVKLKSMTKFMQDSNLRMLKAFSIDNCQLGPFIDNQCGERLNDYPCGIDLSGNVINHEKLTFYLEEPLLNRTSQDKPFENQDLVTHFFGTDQPATPVQGEGSTRITTGLISGFLQIGPNTIYTTFKLRADKTLYTDSTYGNGLFLFVYHAKNGSATEGNKTILERGRYFADDGGKELDPGNDYTITFYEPDRGYNDDIMAKSLSAQQFMFGCPVEEVSGQLEIQESAYDADEYANHPFYRGDVIDLLHQTLHGMQNALYDPFYQGEDLDLFDIADAPGQGRLAFWGDVGMFGWLDAKPGEVLVNMATMLNCYLFVNEAGKIVFQRRLLHEEYLPGSLPPGAFEVDFAHIQPLGDQQDNNGFDSYEIAFTDRIEINNIESETERTVYVGDEGVREQPALRNSTLEVEAYRTQNLGVPARANGLPLFRRSPDDASFGIAGVGMYDFIPTPVEQAQSFAKSWSYPTRTWKLQWDSPKYPDAGIGGYFWVDWGSEKRVYFIRDITHDVERLLHKMEVQEVGLFE